MLDESQLNLIRRYKAKTKSPESLVNAAVSIVLRNKNEPEFLLMQRAKHPKDPWSGQMAFPGGKFESQDSSYKQTAIRETKEEVGLELKENEFIGQLDDVYGVKANGVLSVHVACFVFKLDREVTLNANYEVADLVWLPLSYLEDTLNSFEYYHPHDDCLRMPAILIDKPKEQILWGLSLRMLVTLFSVLNRPMGALTSSDKDLLAQIEKRAHTLDA